MKKIYAVLACAGSLLLAVVGQAQIGYTFTTNTSPGNYTPLDIGGFGTATPINLTVASTQTPPPFPASDEGFANGFPIGFTFSYAGQACTHFHVSSNGFMRLGINATSNTFNTGNAGFDGIEISNGATMRIAPFLADLDVAQIGYELTGVSPNRILTVEWQNAKYDYLAANPVLSIQVKLFETSNQIRFVYNRLAGAQTVNRIALIGMSGLSNQLSLDTTTNQLIGSSFLFRNAPATGVQHTFVKANNDIAVYKPASYGKAGSGTFGHTVRFITSNIGTTAQTNRSFTLTVSGANSLTRQITGLSFPAPTPLQTFGAAFVNTFPQFTLPNPGKNIIRVTMDGTDDVNGNNTFVDSIFSNGPSENVLTQHSGNELDVDGIVNLGTNTGLVGRFFGGANSLVSARVAANTGSTYNLILFGKNPANNGLPGPAIDSVTNLVGTGGYATVAFATPRAVTDTFYLGYRSLTAAATGFLYQYESPLRLGAYFIQGNGTSTWGDIGGSLSANPFRFSIGANFATSLPVQFGEFTGSKINRVNVLNWNTVNEANNRGFEIQKSADGRSFSTIGFTNTLAADGNSNSPLKYSFNDERAEATAYYRLMQVDKDGKTSFSKVIVIKGEEKSSLEITAVYPNPTVRQLNLSVVSAETGLAQIVVSDLNGKQVISQRNSLVRGDNQLSLNVANLSNGTYYIKMVGSNGQVSTHQFIKQ